MKIHGLYQGAQIQTKHPPIDRQSESAPLPPHRPCSAAGVWQAKARNVNTGYLLSHYTERCHGVCVRVCVFVCVRSVFVCTVPKVCYSPVRLAVM